MPNPMFISYQYVTITERHPWSEKVTLHVYCNLHLTDSQLPVRRTFYGRIDFELEMQSLSG
jgi:hypothetical protein